MEQLNSIFNSWTYYTPISAVTAVFFVLDALLLIAFFSHEEGIKKICLPDKKAAVLAFYGGAVSLLILFPLTAMLLRQFQSVFYPYVYLWLMVPVIPVTAYGLTKLIFNLKAVMKKVLYIAAVILTGIVLLLCGSMGNSELREDTDQTSDNIFTYNECLPFLEKLDELSLSSSSKDSDTKFTILAPKEITEYIHMYTGNVATLYGRDIWDTGLAPYTYNLYPDEYYDLYTWEIYAETYGAFYYEDGESAYYYSDCTAETLASLNGGTAYIELAKQSGADAIVFYIGPGTDTQALEFLTADYSTETFYLNENEGYLIILLQPSS